MSSPVERFTSRALELCRLAEADAPADRELLLDQALLELQRALDAYERQPVERVAFPEEGLVAARKACLLWWARRGIDVDVDRLDEDIAEVRR